MKKRSIGIIGLACLTAGIGLAGCAGSNEQPTEVTTTAESTTVAETTTTTAETTTTTQETTTTTEAPTTTAKAHPEDDVFIAYLQKIYSNADDYVQGCPIYIGEGMEKEWESISLYSKYAITDFDNDGRDELLLRNYDNNGFGTRSDYVFETGYGIFEMYEVNETGEVIMNPYRGMNHYGRETGGIKFLNNGVIIQKTHVDEYIPFNYDIRSNLAYVKKWGDQDLYNFTYNYGHNQDPDTYESLEGYYCEVLGSQDVASVPISEEVYNSELKLLNSGSEIDVAFKDFTAENIGL